MLEKVLNLQIRIDQSTYRETKKRIDELQKDLKVKFGKIGLAGGGGGGTAAPKKSWAQETAERQIKEMALRRSREIKEADRQTKREEARAERERIKKIRNQAYYMKEAGFDKKEIEYRLKRELGDLTEPQFKDLMQRHTDEKALGRGRINEKIEQNKPSPEEKQEEQRKEQRQRQYDQRGGIYSQPVTQRILRGIMSGSFSSLAKTIAPIGAAVGGVKLVSGLLRSINGTVTPIRASELMRAAAKGSTYNAAGATGAGTPYSKFSPKEMGSALNSAYDLQMNSLFQGMNGFAQSLGIDPFQSEEEMLSQVSRIAKDAKKKGGWFQKQIWWGLMQAGFDPKDIMKLADEAPITESLGSTIASDIQHLWGFVSGQTGQFPEATKSSLSEVGRLSKKVYTQDPSRLPNIQASEVYKVRDGMSMGGSATTSLLIQSMTINGNGDPKQIADEVVKAIDSKVKDTVQQIGAK